MEINPLPPLSNLSSESSSELSSQSKIDIKKIFRIAGLSQTNESNTQIEKIEQLIQKIEKKVESGNSQKNLKKDLSQIGRQIATLYKGERGQELPADIKEKIKKILFKIGMGMISESTTHLLVPAAETAKVKKKLQPSKKELERLNAKENSNMTLSAKTISAGDSEQSLDFLKNYGLNSKQIESMSQSVMIAISNFLGQWGKLTDRTEKLVTKFTLRTSEDNASSKPDLKKEIESIEMQKNELDASIEHFSSEMISSHLANHYSEDKKDEAISRLNNFIIERLTKFETDKNTVEN